MPATQTHPVILAPLSIPVPVEHLDARRMTEAVVREVEANAGLGRWSAAASYLARVGEYGHVDLACVALRRLRPLKPADVTEPVEVRRFTAALYMGTATAVTPLAMAA